MKRICETCAFFREAGFIKSGWCDHPERTATSDVMLMVRSAELACRNGWGNDSWVARSDEDGIEYAKAAAQATAERSITSSPMAMVTNPPSRPLDPSGDDDIVVRQGPAAVPAPRNADVMATDLVVNPKEAIRRAREQFRDRNRVVTRDEAYPIGMPAERAVPEAGPVLAEARTAAAVAVAPSVPPVQLDEIDRSFPTMTSFPDDDSRFESIPACQGPLELPRATAVATMPIVIIDAQVEARPMEPATTTTVGEIGVGPQVWTEEPGEDAWYEDEWAEPLPPRRGGISSLLGLFQRRPRTEPLAPVAWDETFNDGFDEGKVPAQAWEDEPVAPEPVVSQPDRLVAESYRAADRGATLPSLDDILAARTAPVRRSAVDDSLAAFVSDMGIVIEPAVLPAAPEGVSVPEAPLAARLSDEALDQVRAVISAAAADREDGDAPIAEGYRARRTRQSMAPDTYAADGARIQLEPRPDRRRESALPPVDLPAPASFEPATAAAADRFPMMAQVRMECRTCRDFRPADGGERGWCNNQRAFTHRRMVSAQGIPCNSTLGNWWLPYDETWTANADVSHHSQPTPLTDRWLPGRTGNDEQERGTGTHDFRRRSR